MSNTLCQQIRHMPVKRAKKLYNFIFGDDLDFYEEFTIHLTDEQQKRFFDENPEFMSEFQVNHGKIYLLKNERFRDSLRNIKRL